MTIARGRLVRRDAAARGAPNEPATALTDALVRVAALAMRANAEQAQTDQAALDRIVDLARLLAERLLRKSVELAPETIRSLAEGVLVEARSARRVMLVVHPSHVPLVERATSAFDPDGRVHGVTADPSLGPCDVRLETELGNVDARIEVELAELARRLRDALRS